MAQRGRVDEGRIDVADMDVRPFRHFGAQCLRKAAQAEFARSISGGMGRAGQSAERDHVDEDPMPEDEPPSAMATISSVIASRSEEHTSELQSLMHISNAVLCLTKKKVKATIPLRY